jgi:SPP1 gp7 family putative phage head morphogenesis protein
MPDLKPLPFLEAIAWARARQVVLPDVYYGELQGLARSMAFSIAGLAKLDQLQAVMDSLSEATANGESFGAWAKRATDPAGNIRLDLPAHRIENVFRTNIGSHYARGRCEQQRRAVEDFPYRMYDAVNDSRTRPAHAAMDGVVARHDDPLWSTWRPPNGYQCRCRLIALTERQAARFIDADAQRMQDQEAATARAAAQPDKGWDYDICAEPTEGVRRAMAQRRQECGGRQFASKRGGSKLWCQGKGADYLAMLEAVANSGGKMPEPRRVDIPLLPTGQTERFYLERFMREFGEEWDGTAIIEAPSGHALAVSGQLFTNHKTGATKIDKEGRAPYVPYIAETIKAPDEIWLSKGSAGDQTLYFLAWYLIGGQSTAIMAVFKGGRKAWEGWSGYQSLNMAYIETKRTGILVYRNQKR